MEGSNQFFLFTHLSCAHWEGIGYTFATLCEFYDMHFINVGGQMCEFYLIS